MKTSKLEKTNFGSVYAVIVPNYVDKKAVQRLKDVVVASNFAKGLNTSFHPLEFDKYQKIVVVTGSEDNKFFSLVPVKKFFDKIAKKLQNESYREFSPEISDVEKESWHLLGQEKIDDELVSEAQDVFPEGKNPFSLIKARKLVFDDTEDNIGKNPTGKRVKDQFYLNDLGDIDFATGEIRPITRDADKKDAQNWLDIFDMLDIQKRLKTDLQPLKPTDWDFPLPKKMKGDGGSLLETDGFARLADRMN